MDLEQLQQELMKYSDDEIRNPKILSNGFVDADMVDIKGKSVTEIEIPFNSVSRFFNYTNCRLTTLKNSPQYVGGNFFCSGNSLTTLEYGPDKVDGVFFCRNNDLTTIKGLPAYIGGDFYCELNFIPVYEYRWLFYTYIGEKIYTGNEIIDVFLNKNKNPSKKDLPKVLSELKRLVI